MAVSEKGQAARVRELCRKLQPIVHTQANRIWQAYLVENDTGKEQILQYLELLAAQHFQGQLDDEMPSLLPPERDEAAGEYNLGTVTYNDKELHPFGLRENEWIQHVGVFGRSGAGKTNLGFLIVQRLLEQKKPVLILDWKRNYRDLLDLPGFEDVAVYTIGRGVSPLSFNPLIPPPETNPKTWLKKLISVIAHAYLLGNGVLYLLQETLDRVYRDAGVYDGSVERWPTLQDVQRLLKARQTTGREAGWMSSALRALASLNFGEMDTLLNQGNDNLKELFTRPVILELDALTQSDKVFFVQALLLWIHHFRMTQSSRERFDIAVLIEEAHHVLTGERQSLVGGQSVMELTFREIREFGVGIILLDQHPSQISMPALGNTYCTFCFNLKHRTDVNAMAQAMLLQDSEKQLLGSLPLGQAVVRLQGRAKGPFIIDVPEFSIRKGQVTDTDVVYRMTRLGLLAARNHPVARGPAPSLTDDLRPAHAQGSTDVGSGDNPEAEASPSSSSSLPSPDLPVSATALPNDDKTLAFLRDVERFPDSGIAERYKRIGLSVRQGQKLKEQVIEQGLLTEQVQMTRIGKLRVVALTEDGRLAVRSSLTDTSSDTR